MPVSPTRLRTRLRRHRRALAVSCAALALGVLAHHALPEDAMAHHMGDHSASAAMVMCLGLVAAAGIWAVGRLPRLRPLGRPRLIDVRPTARAPAPAGPVPRARAGPLGPVVLRI